MKVTQPLPALKQLSTIVALGAAPGDVFATALEQMVTLMGANMGSIQLLSDGSVLHTVAVYGDISEPMRQALREFTIVDIDLEPMLNSDRAHVLSNMTETLAMASPLAALLRQEGFNTAVRITLRAQNTCIGLLSVGYRRICTVPRRRLEWFEAMSNLISISLYNGQLLADLHANQSALQDAWKAVTDAQEMERSRLSRELHDEVGQALTSLMLRMKALQSETDVETIGDRLNGLRYLTGKTLEEVRRISMDLHPVVFDELGLIPAIRSYVRECSTWAKVEITFGIIGTVCNLRPELEIACYRVVQEGLTNVIRHARAGKADVELTYHEQSVTLSIRDDGVGMDANQEVQRVGLLGMQERVRLVGGTVDIVSEPGRGVTLFVVFPRGTTEA